MYHVTNRDSEECRKFLKKIKCINVVGLVFRAPKFVGKTDQYKSINCFNSRSY